MARLPRSKPGRMIAPGFAGVTLTGLAMTGSTSVLALTGLLALVVLTVMVPAVWSRKKQRRDAALEVLNLRASSGEVMRFVEKVPEASRAGKLVGFFCLPSSGAYRVSRRTGPVSPCIALSGARFSPR
jgi:hypothetical protein